jgi:hypothetical protein
MECESEYNAIVSILRDFSRLCHTCIEEICNISLRNVNELKIDSPTKRVDSYILFVQQNLFSIRERFRCNDKCSENKNIVVCDNSEGLEDSEEDRKMTIEEFHKLTKMFKLKHEKAEKKKKKKKKNKTK